MEKKLWYAVMRDSDDNDWGIGSYYRNEAEYMVFENISEYPDGYIAVIDEGDGTPISKICVDEIYPEDFDFNFDYWSKDAIVAFVKPQDAWDNPHVEEAVRTLAGRAGVDPDSDEYEDWADVARAIQDELDVDLGI